MNILLTGANGYIGFRLLLELLDANHYVTAVVRDKARLPIQDLVGYEDRYQIIETDFSKAIPTFPSEIDVAYFLIHAMGEHGDFFQREVHIAKVFLSALERTNCKQIVYLGGLAGNQTKLSKHLESRQAVQTTLKKGSIPLTTLRASIIVGSGSASFEIIRDLVEKIPILITPRWTRNLCQPIAIRNVIQYLIGVALLKESFNKSFDIGGPDRLTYQDLLKQYAEVRGLKRCIVAVPVLSLRLSSHWLYFISKTSLRIARSLVESLAYDTICENDAICQLVPQQRLTYRQAIEKAFAQIAQNRVPSSWFDSLASGGMNPARLRSIHVPEHGVLRDKRVVPFQGDREQLLDAIWKIGGNNGWPAMNWAWRVRGFLDRLVGGIGVRRGRRDPIHLRTGDALDFWRVQLADRSCGRLILYAEMKLPGEAWLEFHVTQTELIQTATFRPLGIFGRLYWFASMPFHTFLFPKMAQHLVEQSLSSA